MLHSQQVKQIRALIECIDSHTVPQAEAVVGCPTSSFTNTEQAAAEREILFRGHPQMIGLSSELDGPSTFITRNDFGLPVLATRDKNGKFHAFLNSCRHRGAQVTLAQRGKATRFVCPYHAWTYGDDGRLLVVREPEFFGKIDKACNGLIELPSADKYGMLWVHPKPDGVLNVDALLGLELSNELHSWNLGRCVYEGELAFDRPLNWKLASDTFCEAYHFGVLHSRTVANIVHGDFTTYRTFGNNHCMIVPNKNIKTMLERPESAWNLPLVSSIAYYLFPNVHLIINGNVLSVTRIFPDSDKPGQSVSRISIFRSDHLLRDTERDNDIIALSGENIYSADASKPVALDISALKELFHTTVDQEDYQVACQIQLTADSRIIDHIKFGRNEPGVQHAHNAIREALGMPALGAYRLANT